MVASHNSPHIPTIHCVADANTIVYTISFCTGTLMRLNVNNRWVSSKEEDSAEFVEYHTVLSPCASIVPFPERINPVRMGLSNIYLQQAVCKPYCDYMPGMRIVPYYEEGCIGIQDYMLNRLVNNPGDTTSMPGLNLFAVFVNMQLTYEDAMVLSRTASLLFKYRVIVTRIISTASENIPKPQDIIKPYEREWWQCHFTGTVVSVTQRNVDDMVVLIESECYPVNGDKFTTLHGQKGVITIINDEDMPHVNNRAAQIVIGSSSVLKRETISQLLEAACSQYALDHMDNSVCHSWSAIQDHYKTSRTHGIRYVTDILRTYEAEVFFDGHTITRRIQPMHGNIIGTGPVRANYGTIRVMQSCFLASYRSSGTARMASSRSKTSAKPASQGGSKILGEMEVTQLVGSGLSHCLQELSDRSDVHVVTMCSACNLLLDICVCDPILKRPTRIALPLETIKFIYASRVALDLNVLLF